MKQDNEADFLDRLYAVAMEPERFVELVEVWRQRLSLAQADGRLADEAELQHLENHLSRAETLLGIAQKRSDEFPVPLNEVMESEPRAMLAIDSTGIIRAANAAARKTYGRVEEEPLGALPFDEDALAQLAEKARGLTPDAGDRNFIDLVRALGSENDTSTLLSMSSRTTAGGRTVLIVKSIDFTWPDAWTPLMEKTFGLTPAELAVLKSLAEGYSPQQIADQRAASLATIRTQVRSIYDKTGTHNQSQFLRMALGLGSLGLIEKNELLGIFPASPQTAVAPYPRPEHRRLLGRPGDRVMEYADFGDPDGRCCLYLHNEFFGDVWRAAGVERAKELGLRIIAPARPCYGQSTCLSGGVSTPESITGDMVALLDHLGIETVVPLFQMAGGVFALDLAERARERVAALAIVAPIFPIRNSREERKLPDFHTFLSSVIHRHPRLLEFICKSGMAYHDRVGTRRFFRTFAKDHDPDLALVDDDEIFFEMARGAKYCGAHGHRGFFNDYRHVPLDAFERFAALEMPMVALIGDAIPEGRNTQLLRLLEAHGNSETMLASGGAHYLHFSHPRDVSELAWQAWEKAGKMPA